MWEETPVARVECLWKNTFFIWSQFHSISSVPTVSCCCFQGNHISKVWCHFGEILWNLLKLKKNQNTHKFPTAGFFNEQRESDLTICIQIGPSFLQCHLLKTHFCLVVGFSEGVKNPVIYIINGDITIPTQRAQEFYCYTIHKWGFGSFFWVLFLISFYFWEHFIHSICLLVIFDICECLGMFICRKTHKILYFLATE